MVELIGTCYEDAWRFLIKEEEGELIHGTVESLGRRVGHAWVELPTSFIWEPESRRFIKKADFQAMAKPQEEARYSVTEAAIMLARVGKHGPWTKEEKEQFLKRGNPMGGRLEPWQMTQQDFVKVYLERFKSMLSKEAFARVTPEELQKEREEAIDYQKHTIRQALKAGRPVPPEVLREYPDLAKEHSNLEAVPEVGRSGLGRMEEGLAVARLQGAISNLVERGFEVTPLRHDYVDDLIKLGASKRWAEAMVDRVISEAKPKKGGNPMRTEAQRKSVHERIFGKGSTLPERLGRGQIVNDLMPMSPEQGPPLPRMLAIRWPWRKP